MLSLLLVAGAASGEFLTPIKSHRHQESHQESLNLKESSTDLYASLSPPYVCSRPDFTCPQGWEPVSTKDSCKKYLLYLKKQFPNFHPFFAMTPPSQLNTHCVANISTNPVTVFWGPNPDTAIKQKEKDNLRIICESQQGSSGARSTSDFGSSQASCSGSGSGSRPSGANQRPTFDISSRPQGSASDAGSSRGDQGSGSTGMLPPCPEFHTPAKEQCRCSFRGDETGKDLIPEMTKVEICQPEQSCAQYSFKATCQNERVTKRGNKWLTGAVKGPKECNRGQQTFGRCLCRNWNHEFVQICEKRQFCRAGHSYKGGAECKNE